MITNAVSHKQRFHLRLIYLLLIFSSSFNCLNAQQPHLHFKRVSLQQGLSQSTVFSIAQDTVGFLWFATLDGLNRYNGYNFTVYRPIPGDSNAIPELGIRKLYRDRAGNLWIITMGGKLSRYLPGIDGFRHYPLTGDSADAARPHRAIDLAEDASGNLFLALSNGKLYTYNSELDAFLLLPFPPPGSDIQGKIHLQCLDIDYDDVFWLGTWEGLIRYHSRTSRIIRYRHRAGEESSLGGNIVFDLAEDARGHLWVGTANGGVTVLDRQGRVRTVYQHEPEDPGSLSSNRVMRVFADSRQRIWIGTVDAGLNLYDPQGDGFIHYQHDSGQPASLGSGAIMSIYEDNSGALWFGTSGGGVSRYDRHCQRFRHIVHNTNDPGSLSANPVLSILEDRRGGLWVGSDGGGLNYRPPGKQRFKHLLTQPGNTGSNSIIALFEDRRGTIWIGTDPGSRNPAGAIFRYDPYKRSLTLFTEISLTMGGVATFFEDRHDDIWIGTTIDGVRRYQPSTGTITVYRHDKADPHSLSGNSVFAIVEDAEGDVWFGTIHGGLSRWHRRTGRFTRYRSHPEHPDSLGNNTVWCLYADSSGDVWMGTWGGGLNVFRSRLNGFQRFTVQDGLPSNVINGILPDSKGNLWLSTNRGLCRFDPVTLSCKNYDESDGLQSNEFNQGAAFRGRDGRLYFGGVNGVTVFQPGDIIENRHIPPVVLTRFRVFDKELPLPQPLRFTREITLSYRQNFFSFEFAALDYTAPEKNQYSYMLEGVDPDWVLAGNRRYASYTNISSGEYVFKVKGANNDGVWNEQPVEVIIRITPPFWQTWWSRLLTMMTLVALLYALHRYRVNKLLAVERTRLRIARDLHDEVSATITGMVYFSDAIEKEIGSGKTPKLQKLLSLVHDSAAAVQDSMSDIIWCINPGNDRWEVILAKMRRFTSDLCESKGIQYRIDIPESLPAKTLIMERRHDLWLIFKEMVTNGVKHSGCTELTVSITLRGNRLNLRVADDGKGFDPDAATGGNGIKNIYNRANGLDAQVQLTTRAGEGTRWELVAPV